MKRSVFANIVFILIELGVAAALWFAGKFRETELWIKIAATALIVIDIVKDISTLANAAKLNPKEKKGIVWKDRTRTFLGLPISFTRYRLTKEKLILDKGFFNRKESEIRLYRIVDLDMTRSFGQRLLGIGTITVTSSDKSDGTLHIKNIKRPSKTKELISQLVEAERKAKSVTGREIIDNHPDFDPLVGGDCNCCEPGETI